MSMLVSTISGGGNNVILIPVLILAFNFSPNVAIGTSFLALIPGTIVSAVEFYRKRRIDIRRGLLLGLASIPGVITGSLLASVAQDTAFKIVLALVIIGLSILMLFRDRLVSRTMSEKATNGTLKGSAGSQDYKVNLKIGFLILLLVGFFVGIFGQGGGLVVIPILLFLGFPILVSLGTTRLIALLVGVTALAVRLGEAQVNMTFGLALAIGAMVGGFLGVEFSSYFRAGVLRWVVTALIASLGVLMLLQVAF